MAPDQLAARFHSVLVAPVHVLAALAVYGPTIGPPPGAPTGTTGSVDVSAIARSRFRRPLPVWSADPAASALRARRPTITAFEAEGAFAFSRAAAPATRAAAAEVPVTDVVAPAGVSAVMPTPGAAMSVAWP